MTKTQQLNHYIFQPLFKFLQKIKIVIHFIIKVINNMPLELIKISKKNEDLK